MHLVTGTGNSPSPGQPTPGVVKQDKSSGGSVDTTKTRPDPQRVRMSSGERLIGAAKGKQSDTEALCHPPPPRTRILSWEKMKLTKGSIDLVYFLVHKLLDFWVPDPPPPPPPLKQDSAHPPASAPISRIRQVRLLIDAEQTYMQVAIDHFALKMQREYNQQFPTIFNTYQCYLDFARNRLDNDLERSQREGWVFAAKLVRGAWARTGSRLDRDGGRPPEGPHQGTPTRIPDLSDWRQTEAACVAIHGAPIRIGLQHDTTGVAWARGGQGGGAPAPMDSLPLNMRRSNPQPPGGKITK